MNLDAFASGGLFGAGDPLLQAASLGLDWTTLDAEVQTGLRYGALLSSATVASATLLADTSFATALGAPSAQATRGDLPSSGAVDGPEVGAGAAISPGPRTAAVAHSGRTRGVTYG